MENTLLKKINKDMEQIVEKEVTYYKSDILHDFKILKNDFKLKKGLTYIWILRECGTNLMREDFIPVKNSNENIIFNGMIGLAKKCYRIKIDKACKVNIYGSIEKVNLKKYTKEIKEKERKFNQIKARIVLNDNKVIENNYEFEEGYYSIILRKEKIEVDMVKEFEILSFS